LGALWFLLALLDRKSSPIGIGKFDVPRSHCGGPSAVNLKGYL
jgi:hypothetical protein